MVDQITCSSGKAVEKISKEKIKKRHKLSGNSVIKDNGSTRSKKHLYIFTFLNDFSVFCDNFSSNIVNATNSGPLEPYSPYSYDISCISNSSEVFRTFF